MSYIEERICELESEVEGLKATLAELIEARPTTYSGRFQRFVERVKAKRAKSEDS